MRKILTTLEDLDLLGREVGQKGTRLEHLQEIVAGVGDQGLDFSVADQFELDREGLGASGHRQSTGHRGEKRNAGEELHLEKVIVRNVKRLVDRYQALSVEACRGCREVEARYRESPVNLTPTDSPSLYFSRQLGPPNPSHVIGYEMKGASMNDASSICRLSPWQRGS